MSGVLVDSNILLDLFTEDKVWFDWSQNQLSKLALGNALIINPIIYGEISYRFTRIEDLDNTLNKAGFRRETLPFAAAFFAAKCHAEYRRRGGSRLMTLPDFYIGAHAAVAGMTLLTRDGTRYRTYFPKLRLIAP